ncbi:alpha/beta fold hydrolase [Glaesserella sp.]|uniref:alpha/beta fold hydrolase n=1 Tax=Glaesserella sp. TaxID=2094731 RepID=UPI0035A1CEEC
MKKLLPAFVLLSSISLTAYADNLRYFGQTPQSYQSSINYGDTNGKYLQSNDAKIYYEIHGQGEPIVVLHGGLVGSIAEMGQLIDHLSQNYQVIAINTRGHGKSEIGRQTPSYAVKAQDVYNVLTHITDKPAHILGFSDGAYTAYLLCPKLPK